MVSVVRDRTASNNHKTLLRISETVLAQLMTKRTITILMIAFLLLLVVLQLSGLLFHFHHDTYASSSVHQSKAAQLFVKEVDIALPGFKSAWIERQCNHYSICIFVIDIASWDSIRNDYALVCHYDSNHLQRWPRYDNVPFILNQMNSGMGIVRLQAIEDFENSRITIGPSSFSVGPIK